MVRRKCPVRVLLFTGDRGEHSVFRRGSPGETDDTEPQMPSFGSMLKDLDKDKDGALSRVEAEKAFEGFFDNQDAELGERTAATPAIADDMLYIRTEKHLWAFAER